MVTKLRASPVPQRMLISRSFISPPDAQRRLYREAAILGMAVQNLKRRRVRRRCHDRRRRRRSYARRRRIDRCKRKAFFTRSSPENARPLYVPDTIFADDK